MHFFKKESKKKYGWIWTIRRIIQWSRLDLEGSFKVSWGNPNLYHVPPTPLLHLSLFFVQSAKLRLTLFFFSLSLSLHLPKHIWDINGRPKHSLVVKTPAKARNPQLPLPFMVEIFIFLLLVLGFFRPTTRSSFSLFQCNFFLKKSSEPFNRLVSSVRIQFIRFFIGSKRKQFFHMIGLDPPLVADPTGRSDMILKSMTINVGIDIREERTTHIVRDACALLLLRIFPIYQNNMVCTSHIYSSLYFY